MYAERARLLSSSLRLYSGHSSFFFIATWNFRTRAKFACNSYYLVGDILRLRMNEWRDQSGGNKPTLFTSSRARQSNYALESYYTRARNQ